MAFWLKIYTRQSIRSNARSSLQCDVDCEKGKSLFTTNKYANFQVGFKEKHEATMTFFFQFILVIFVPTATFVIHVVSMLSTYSKRKWKRSWKRYNTTWYSMLGAACALVERLSIFSISFKYISIPMLRKTSGFGSHVYIVKIDFGRRCRHHIPQCLFLLSISHCSSY